jgi:hypothetical protein
MNEDVVLSFFKYMPTAMSIQVLENLMVEEEMGDASE